MTVQARLKLSTGRARAGQKRGTARGLQRAADRLLEVSQARIPLDQGELRDSGVASIDRGAQEAAVSFDTFYAVWQHENLDYKHDPGRTAKYLEEPAHTERPELLAIMAEELRRNLK